MKDNPSYTLLKICNKYSTFTKSTIRSMDLKLPMQSVSITTNVVSSNLAKARCTTLCDKVCQWFAASRWFSPGTLASCTNKTDRYDKTEKLLKVALNIINQPKRTTLMYVPKPVSVLNIYKHMWPCQVFASFEHPWSRLWTYSDCPFGISKLFLFQKRNDITLLRKQKID